ncbi:MAG: urease accessory protein UreD [Aquabacterium sp.]|jgi:urease accessory protein|nr:MAG: urease accessory protein UreD [Aquabacterium sp.]
MSFQPRAFVQPDPGWEIGKYALLNLRARVRAGRTEVDPVARRIPYQWLGAHYQDHDDQPFVLLQNSSGGFVEGDTAALHLHMEPGARLLVTTASAAKFYKCEHGGQSEEIVDIDVADGATLEYLPDEVIPYAASRTVRRTRIHMAAGARLFATDLIAAGRIHHRAGEAFAFHAMRSEFEVWLDGRLIVLDRLFARTPEQARELEALWAGRQHLGMVVAYVSGMETGIEETLHEALAQYEGVTAGVSRIGDLVCVRLLAAETWHAHAAVYGCWEVLRPAIAGKAARPIRKS